VCPNFGKLLFLNYGENDMKKLVLLLVVCQAILAPVFADSYRLDDNTLIWGAGPDPDNQPDGQLWYTYTDWDWYEGSLALDSAWPSDPNTQPWPSELVPQEYCLMIRAPENINGINVVPTGYEFDLEAVGITGKVISNIHITNAMWNFGVGANAAVAPAFYDEEDNRVYRENPVNMTAGWWQGVDIDFTDYPTKKVRFVVEPFDEKWVWTGNYVYLETVTMTLIDESDSKCGTKYNPYPNADLTGDCIVNFEDVAVLAGYWLECNDPACIE
jgi:hypothetical protein